ncbi:hypothetical protein [Hanstruepera marina]|uniref:hypothetical protein n=1 Tax=Hanstruepera marina TaxID=2873265 RepID=UPI001CA73DCD|nr:hypothetical protein [Hanstruepera marina]
MIIAVKHLVPKGFSGITIYPFVLVKNKELKHNVVFVNHERIHLRQQQELLVVLFYVWYILEFLIRLLLYRKWHLAYRNISFEREAYGKEKDLDYLQSRPFWNFIIYQKSLML